MAGVFWLTFKSVGPFLCRIISEGIDLWITKFSDVLILLDINPTVHSLLINGICSGIGGVLTFLPTIAVLFFCLSLMEESGYTKCIASFADNVFNRLGLSGLSVIPMLLGFGCAVPAIMSTQNIIDRRDKILAVIMTPYMSCSARLPIYLMITSTFFPKNQILVILSLYLLGIAISLLVAYMAGKTVLKGVPFKLQTTRQKLKFPSLGNVFNTVWINVKGFIKKAFTVIFIASVAVWFLENFDTEFDLAKNSEECILFSMGKIIAPIFVPLGFGDWRAASALIAGLSAKEAVVSTFSVLTGGILSQTQEMILKSVFTPLSAYSFMAFCLLYMPCIATMATIKKELSGWKYPAAALISQTLIAWITAFLIYNIGLIFC